MNSHIRYRARRHWLATLTLKISLIGASILSLSAVPSGAAARAGASYFGNTVLIAHDGRSVRFYDDLIDGRTVVFTSFFSRCQGVCPPLMNKLKAIQRAFGERVGKDVLIVSISADPEFDTPERLETYAETVGVGDGWLMLSGEPDNVRKALYKLGFATSMKEAHSPLLVIGKEKTGLWKKAHGFAPVEDLITIVASVIHDGE